MNVRFAIEPERRDEILKLLRRVALIALPALGLSLFVGLLAWSIRRQLDTLVKELPFEPTEEAATETVAGAKPG